MPSTYAHTVFGKLVAERYPENLRRLSLDHQDLFMIGLHGPDILFYYKALVADPVNAVGYGQHGRPAADFFGPASDLVRSSPLELRSAQTAYLLGFLCHFALDSACHGYIEKKILVSGITHTEIEVEFDRYLMVQRGLDPIRHSLTGHIHPTPESAAVIAPFFPSVTPDQVERALRSMISYNRMLLVPHWWHRAAVTLMLRLSGNYKEMHGLMVNRTPNPACRDSNVRLEKLMDRAAEQCLALTEEYLPCLTGEAPLPAAMARTFGPGADWRDIPVLSIEEEMTYEI